MARHTLREAVAAFRRSPLLTGLSAAMVALALFVVGLFGLAAYNLHVALANVEERVQVVAYIRDGTSTDLVESARKTIEAEPTVAAVRYVSKAEALKTARAELSEIGELASNLEVNPFPASLEVSLAEGSRSPETVDDIAGQLRALPFVEDVRFGREWVDKLFLIRRIGGITALVIGGAFGVVAALIIGTAIRIAIFARRDEIQIMRLVGATHAFIRRPFVLEGALTGLAGGALASLLTWICYRTVNEFLFRISWIPPAWIAAGVAAGALFGALSSGLAVRRHLREV